MSTENNLGNNTENKYVSLSTIQGRDQVYNVVRINSESINAESLPGVINNFFDYFADDVDKKNGGNGNNIIDLQNKALGSEGLDALVWFTKFHKNKHGIRAILMNCNPSTEQIINTAGLRKEFDIAYDWAGL